MERRVVAVLLAWSLLGLGMLTLATAGCGDSGGASGSVDQQPQADGLSDLGERGGGLPTDVATEGLSDEGGPDAADDALDDTGDDAGPDAAGETDGGGGGALSIDEAQRQTFCAAYCATIGAGCGYGAVGGSDVACRAACGALSAEDGWWLANYGCYSGSCDASRCALDGPPLAEEPQCQTACEALDACDLLPLFQLPEDQPEACRAACTGAAITTPTFAASLPCVADALDPACDQQAYAQCFAGEQPTSQACAQFCAPAYNPQDPMYCGPDSAQRSTWPTAAECTAACSALPDYPAELRFVGCLQASACGDVSSCEALPPADAPECTSACGAIFGLCGTFGGIGDQPTCNSYCTGIVHAYGVELEEDPASCIAAADACPTDDGGLGNLYYGCLLSAPAACEALCAGAGACLQAAGQPFDEPECRLFCLSGGLGDMPAVEGIAGCMDAAGEECADVLACLPQPAVEDDPLCAALCAKATDACGAPADPSCVATCSAALAAEPTALAEVICRLHAPCGGPDATDVCEGASEQPPPEACVNACTAASDACSAYPEACASACSGALAAADLEADQAFCVVWALGESCDASGLAACSE